MGLLNEIKLEDGSIVDSLKNVSPEKWATIKSMLPDEIFVSNQDEPVKPIKKKKLIKAQKNRIVTLTEKLHGINPHTYNLNDFLEISKNQIENEREYIKAGNAESNPFRKFISLKSDLSVSDVQEIKNQIAQLYTALAPLKEIKNNINRKGTVSIVDGKIVFNEILKIEEQDAIYEDLSLQIADGHKQIKALRQRIKVKNIRNLTVQQQRTKDKRDKNKAMKNRVKAIKELEQNKLNLVTNSSTPNPTPSSIRNAKVKANSAQGSYYVIQQKNGKIESIKFGDNGTKYLKSALNLVNIEIPDSKTNRREYTETTNKYDEMVKNGGVKVKFPETKLEVYIIFTSDIDSVKIPMYAHTIN